MNKSDVIDKVAQVTGEPRTTASTMVEAVFEIITESLKNNEQVNIVGFGNFVVKHREARMGRNPKTGEPAHIAASNQAGFRPGKSLKEALNR